MWRAHGVLVVVECMHEVVCDARRLRLWVVASANAFALSAGERGPGPESAVPSESRFVVFLRFVYG